MFEQLDKSNKRRQIYTSGSVEGATKEKVRSGQSYLYKKWGMESEVFEIRFYKPVTGSFLQQALIRTMVRYPYFNSKMVELDGDFYLVKNHNSPVVRKSRELPKLGGMSNTYHLVDVTYCGSSVYVSFHHSLCDGRGIKPFIETLLYYYCNLKYHSNASSNGIRLADEPLLPGETTEPFTAAYDYDHSKHFISLNRDGFPLPENTAGNPSHSYRYELLIPQDEFMAGCKKIHATPAIFLALLMNQAIAAIHPDFDRDIHANIATDMREGLGVPNTFKNCVKTMTLPYSREFSQRAPEEKAARYRELLTAQRDVDYCKKEANAILSLYQKLDSLPSFAEKQAIMAFYEDMILNTYVISYIGQFVLNENERHIDTIHLYNSGVVGLGINMICCSGKFMLDFKQSFQSDRYVRAFAEELGSAGIAFRLSPAIEFSTPRDRMIKRSQTP